MSESKDPLQVPRGVAAGPAGTEKIRVERISEAARDRASPRDRTAGEDERKIAKALAEAQILLGYAATAGVPLGADVTGPLAQARAAAQNRRWSAEIEGSFWTALSKLAAAVKPVTVGSLVADQRGDAGTATRDYFRRTRLLTAIILPISIVMFVNTRISNEVTQLTAENDAAAVSIFDRLVNYQSPNDPPTAVERANENHLVEQLAHFARTNRQLFAEAQVLNLYILELEREPVWARDQLERRKNLELEVRVGEARQGARSIRDQGLEKIATYQDIRDFARKVNLWNLIIFGAITAYILPIAYALLGACAYALRNVSSETKAKTYYPTYANFARLVIALIAGTVVGLFNNFTQGVSVSPLAIAFLVGYAVEVFFSFLDAFVQTFRKVQAT